MIIYPVIEKSLSLTIPINKDRTKEETRELVDYYLLAEDSLQLFLSQEISFDEYLMRLEFCRIKIDEYREDVEENLLFFGV